MSAVWGAASIVGVLRGYPPLPYTPGGFLISALLGTTLFFALLGYYGVWLNYGATAGGAVCVYGFGAAIAFLLTSVVTASSLIPGCLWSAYGSSVPCSFVLLLGAMVALGIVFISAGATLIATRQLTGSPILSMVAGAFLVVGGSLAASVVFALTLSFLVLVPGLVLGGIVLLRAPIPATGTVQNTPPAPPASPPAGAR